MTEIGKPKQVALGAKLCIIWEKCDGIRKEVEVSRAVSKIKR